VAVLLAGIAGGILLATIHGRQNAGSVIPVAIVNQDDPVTTGSGDDQKKVAAGRELAASLTRPDPGDATPLSWQIVDSDDADSGLRDGAYYAVLTIAEDDERRSLAVSMAKAAAGDAQRLIAQEGIQIMGGMGYTWEHDMHLYVKRAKSLEPLFGTSSTHRAHIADLLGV